MAKSDYGKQGSVFLITSNGETICLPIPSRSPNDPLRWGRLKTFLSLFAMGLFTTIGLIQVQGTSLLLHPLEIEYSQEAPLRIDLLSSVPSLFWGIGALIWVPLSMAIGRRPVFIFCSILLTLSTAMAGFSRNFRTHLAARCFQGFAGSISPSTMILMILDVTFIHQRPRTIALFWCLCDGMSNICLAFTSYILTAGGSWRAFYWVWLGPCFLTILLALVWSPETYFQRPPMAFDGHIIAQSEIGKITVYNSWEEVPGGKPMPDEPKVRTTSEFLKNILFWNRTTIGGWPVIKAFPRQIMICALNPLILWVLVLNSFVFGGMVVTCATYVSVLMAPPYNFTDNEIGLVKFSPFIGSLLAFPASGILTTWFAKILATRNRGVHEPEHYLPSFILPVVTSSISLSLFGIAVEREWDWGWIIFFVGLDYFSVLSMFTSNTLWVTEAFPRWAGAALTVVGGGAYALSFVLGSTIVPWINSQGIGNTYVELGILTWLVGLFGFPVNFWGKRFRGYIYSKWE
ncbi:major facilitator superfamily transporter [Leptodontidium sp. MPI-SDFR-AT-0119]|nr:major facilitator superfamily transporter [Leptodontidium sp. MPI-SDFR-AT-0119]